MEKFGSPGQAPIPRFCLFPPPRVWRRPHPPRPCLPPLRASASAGPSAAAPVRRPLPSHRRFLPSAVGRAPTPPHGLPMDLPLRRPPLLRTSAAGRCPCSGVLAWNRHGSRSRRHALVSSWILPSPPWIPALLPPAMPAVTVAVQGPRGRGTRRRGSIVPYGQRRLGPPLLARRGRIPSQHQRDLPCVA